MSEAPSAERHMAGLNSWIMREDEDCGSICPRNRITKPANAAFGHHGVSDGLPRMGLSDGTIHGP